MQEPSRRSFLKLVAATPLLSATPETPSTTAPVKLVKLFGDGLGLSPSESVDVLTKIVTTSGIEEDDYSRGGVVEELEEKMAAALGKERAIYFATGTLANHVAVRVLAGDQPRVLVPDDSHIYNDSGDCAQQLSQLNLVPLASETATFTLEQVQEVVERTGTGRVATGVGALVIESPVRRKLGEMFDYEEMKRICAFARENSIKTHLDGARLYMASGATGISPREYASHFDTVYVSLWKYFNAASGAILAGPKEVIDGLYHMRRMFGGALPAAWPFAAVTLHYFEGFEAEFGVAMQTAKKFFSLLNGERSFAVRPMRNGSNIFRMTVRDTDPGRFREKLRAHGVFLSPPRGGSGEFLVTVNATWNRTDAETLAETFKASI
ncbi:MAG TPA: beta-eliminating lyase-related protein [Vicinamibacteria bacterium]|nr:beta-eliminating lyase-related protein [Vicinamibacteria bacterium]